MDALSSNQPARSPFSPAPLEGTERRLADYPGREGALLRVPEDVIATAQFAGGTVSGATGCNRYHAPCPGGVASVLDGTEVTAEFGADGRAPRAQGSLRLGLDTGRRWPYISRHDIS